MFWDFIRKLLSRPSAPPARKEMAPPVAPVVPVQPDLKLELPQVPAMKPDLLLARDRKALVGVHPELVRVVERAREKFSFIVTEGVRTVARQRELVAQGKSRTMNSRHLTGHAVDLVPWVDKNNNGVVNTNEIDWSDIRAFRKMAQAMQEAADAEGVQIRWGGNFTGFFDGPHFELSWDKYAR